MRNENARDLDFAKDFLKKVLLVLLVLVLAIASQAQSRSSNSSSYRTALGVKVWDGAGITLKHFFNPKDAGELIGYFWGHGFRLTGLYEIHGNFAGAPGLKWYIGPGAHVAVYNNNYYYHGYYYVEGDARVGIDGVLGLDYKFSRAPINLSLDWQPSFEFGDYTTFYGSWGGLGIRYTF